MPRHARLAYRLSPSSPAEREAARLRRHLCNSLRAVRQRSAALGDALENGLRLGPDATRDAQMIADLAERLKGRGLR